MARTEPPLPTLTATSSEVRLPANRPDPSTSSAGRTALRVCGALSAFNRTRQLPDGSPAAPLIVASPSAEPDSPSPGAMRSSADERQPGRGRSKVEGRPGVTGERKSARADGECEIFDVQTVAAKDQRGRTNKRQPLAGALNAEGRELETGRRPARKPAARLQRKSPDRRGEIEITRIGAARRRQFDVGDRLSGERRSGEAGDAGHDPHAPEVAERQVDFQAIERIGADAHLDAVGDDRDRLLPPAGVRSGTLACSAPLIFVRTSGERSSRFAALKLNSPLAKRSLSIARLPARRADARLTARLSATQPPSACLAT